MKKILSLALCCLVSLAFWAGGAWAAQICVDPSGGGTHTDLQAALTYAQANGEDDLIKVVHGTYSGHFTYGSGDGYNITLVGGYTAECTGRVVDPSLTILDGASTGATVLYLYNTNGGNIRVDGFTIKNGSGGGVYAWSYSASATAGDITLTNNIITGNSTSGAGGGVHAQTNSDSGTAGSVTFTNNTITGNTAYSNWGGGVHIVSSAPVAAGTVTFTNNTIQGNTVTGNANGGGVSVQHYSGVGTAGADAIIFTDNTIQGNTACFQGGVIADAVSSTGTTGNVTFTNNTIAGNSASDSIGGVWARSYSNSGTGGGIVTVTNNTITGNTASSVNGGLYLTKTGNTVNCYNNIIWGNTAPTGGDIYLDAGIGVGTFNGYNNDYTHIYASWDNEGGNIDADPLFVDATTGDYHLRPASPCIDAGTAGAPELPSTDFEGDSRTIGSAPDMGADEYNGALLSACVATAEELQAALTVAQANDRNDLIMVVQGTYTGNFTYNSGQGFSATLQGGYLAGCASRTVNPENTLLDANHSGGVLFLNNTNGGDIQVDGFTIQNGNGASGAGVCAIAQSNSGSAGNITLLNNTISGNTANNNYGGGGYIVTYSTTGTAGTVTLLNNTIRGNTSTTGNYFGGGVFVQTHSGVGTASVGAIIFTDNTIQGNTAGYYGGVFAQAISGSGTAGTVTFINNTIAGNSASDSGGGVYAYSYSSSGTGGTVTYTNNTITGNTASTAGGLFLSRAGNIINFYNNICWGNTSPYGGDIYLVVGTGTANGYNNDYATMSGSWDNADGNINADPLFADPAHGDYHLQGLSPCIDTGNNTPPDGLPSTDFEGDARIIDGDNNGTATVDMGADEYSEFPPDGTIFAGCSLINKYQPFFQWTGLVGPFKSYTIYFSTSATDFATKGIFITKANIKGTMSSYLPSSGVWKKLFTAGWNSGTIRNIYWKVIGTRQDKSTVASAVWNFSVDASYPPEIIAPTEGATLSAAALPTFTFDTACNVKFRLEISSVSNFSDPKKIKAFSYSVKDPNLLPVFTKALSSGQWKSVQKLIGTNTGYFRIKGWDVIKREADSATQSFTITP